ncbi:MAG TPA: tRNA-dihydrouridine synthase family protein [Planctomycetota bacterium]|nr:tRNA-dihydrouridine synthase family protein [Planctomycetota bacterium]
MSLPFAGSLWLAPLTRGGHLAFRRLCVEFGAQVTVGEMAMARRLLREDDREFALLRSHPDEPCFGAQLAGNQPEALAEAARLAEQRGARFVDLNCGCPIHQITGRGLGASLLQKPARIARLVEAMRRAIAVPVTVKLRTGYREGKANVAEVARACEEAGAASLAIHGRSREQRYNRAADWDLIGQVAAERRIPVVGNGDILTHYEASERRERSGVSSLMLARGALIKPWLFREIRESRSWLPTPEERLAVVWRLVELMREHFGYDERGRRRILGFLPWHLDFFSRYRPLPKAEFLEASRRHPLLQTRLPLGDGLAPLERLLRDPRAETHESLAIALVDSGSGEEAQERALQVEGALPPLDAGTPQAASRDEALAAG